MKTKYLSVIIPAYNEARNSGPEKLSQVYNYLKDNYLDDFELILVDDGSTDKTLNLLKNFAQGKKEIIVLNQPHLGKGPTVMAGMLKARGENRLFTDFDQSTPINEIEKLLPFRQKNYDVVIGSREVKGSRRDDEPWYRHLMGRGFNIIVQILTVRGIFDTQCGFKLFSAQAADDLFPRLKVCIREKTISHPFTGAFDVELLFLAHKLDYNIAEVPVLWKHVETPRVNPIYDSIRMFLEVLRIRLTDLSGSYDK